MDSLTVVQWNARSVSKNQADLYFLAEHHKADVLLLSETWLWDGQHFHIPGFNIFRCDRHGANGGGVAIAVKTKFAVRQLSTWMHLMECVAVQVSCWNSEINFISAYIPPHHPVATSPLVELFGQYPGWSFVGGDFNAHHCLWSSRSTPRGERLLDAFEDTGLVVLNTGSPTRITRPNEQLSAVDVTATTLSTAWRCEWVTDPSPYGSDHFPVITIIHPPTGVQPAIQRRRCPRSPLKRWIIFPGLWVSYEQACKDELNNASSQLTPEQRLGQCIKYAADKTFPNNSKGSKRKMHARPVWWNADCQNAVDERNRVFRAFREVASMDNYVEYKRVAAVAKKTLATCKREGWVKFCSKITPELSIADAWRQIRHFKQRKCSPYATFTGGEDMLPDLLCQYTPEIVPVCPPSCLSQAVVDPYLLDEPITLSELQITLNTPRKDTAPGIDGRPYSFYAHLPPQLKNDLLIHFNDVFSKGNVPKEWNQVIIQPILKPGKPANLPTSYRPISLLNCVRKIFMRVLQRRLDQFVEKERILSPHQFAFRRGRGTHDALAFLHSQLLHNAATNGYGVACGIDVQGAYDHVSIDILVQGLAGIGIPPKMLRMIWSLFSERETYVRMGGFLVGPRYARKGLPQGDGLSPLLFNLYVRSLERMAWQKTIVIQYADDVLIFGSRRSLQEATDAVQCTVNLVTSELKKLGLTVSPEKCQLQVFSRHRVAEDPPDLNVYVDNKLVNRSTHFKFLGMFLDSKLLWRPHVLHIEHRVGPRVNLLRALCGVQWGASPSTLLCFYRGLIRPILDYGSHIFEGAAKTHLARLDRLQYRCIRICLGAMRSSPVDALLVEAGELPLTLRRSLLTSRIVIKAAAISTHPLLPQLMSLQSALMATTFLKNKPQPLSVVSASLYGSLVNQSEVPVGMILTSSEVGMFLNSTDIDTEHFQCLPRSAPTRCNEMAFQCEALSRWPGYEWVFVDGSRNDCGNVGSAVYHLESKTFKIYQLSSVHSSYSAEVVALLQALCYIETVTPRKYCVFSDSLSCLSALRNIGRGGTFHPLLPEIVQQANLLHTAGYTIALVWVPGHAGVVGNDIADTSARQAATSGVPLSVPPSADDIMAQVRENTKARWQGLWSGRPTVTNLSRLQNKVGTRAWFQGVKAPRALIVTMVRLRLGHNASPAHLARIGVLPTAVCPCGQAEGTAEHVIMACSRTQAARVQLVQLLQQAGLPTTLDAALKDGRMEVYRCIYGLLVKSGIHL